MRPPLPDNGPGRPRPDEDREVVTPPTEPTQPIPEPEEYAQGIDYEAMTAIFGPAEEPEVVAPSPNQSSSRDEVNDTAPNAELAEPVGVEGTLAGDAGAPPTPPTPPVAPEPEPEPGSVRREVPVLVRVESEDGVSSTEIRTINVTHRVTGATDADLADRKQQWATLRPDVLRTLSSTSHLESSAEEVVARFDNALADGDARAFDAQLRSLARLSGQASLTGGDTGVLLNYLAELRARDRLNEASPDVAPLVDQAMSLVAEEYVRRDYLAVFGTSGEVTQNWNTLTDEALTLLRAAQEEARNDDHRELTLRADKLAVLREITGRGINGDVLDSAARAVVAEDALLAMRAVASGDAPITLADAPLPDADHRAWNSMFQNITDEIEENPGASAETSFPAELAETNTVELTEPAMPVESTEISQPEAHRGTPPAVDPNAPLLGPDRQPLEYQLVLTGLTRHRPLASGFVPAEKDPNALPRLDSDVIILRRYADPKLAANDLLEQVKTVRDNTATQRLYAQGRYPTASDNPDHFFDSETQRPVAPTWVRVGDEQHMVRPNADMLASCGELLPKLDELTDKLRMVQRGFGDAADVETVMARLATVTSEHNAHVAELEEAPEGQLPGDRLIELVELEKLPKEELYQAGRAMERRYGAQVGKLQDMAEHVEQLLALDDPAVQSRVAEVQEKFTETLSSMHKEAGWMLQAEAASRSNYDEARSVNLCTKAIIDEVRRDGFTSETVSEINARVEELGALSPYVMVRPTRLPIQTQLKLRPGPLTQSEAESYLPRLGVPFTPPAEPPPITMVLPLVRPTTPDEARDRQQGGLFFHAKNTRKEDEAETVEYVAEPITVTVDLSGTPQEIVENVNTVLTEYRERVEFGKMLQRRLETPGAQLSPQHHGANTFLASMSDRHRLDWLPSRYATREEARSAVEHLISVRDFAVNEALKTDTANSVLRAELTQFDHGYLAVEWQESGSPPISGGDVAVAAQSADSALKLTTRMLDRLATQMRLHAVIVPADHELPNSAQMRLDDSLQVTADAVVLFSRYLGAKVGEAPEYLASHQIMQDLLDPARDGDTETGRLTPSTLLRLANRVDEAARNLPSNPLGSMLNPKAIAARYLGGDPGEGPASTGEYKRGR